MNLPIQEMLRQRSQRPGDDNMGDVMVVGARGLYVERESACPGECLQGVWNHLGTQLADAIAAQLQIDNCVRPSAHVDGRPGDCLIHWDDGVAEPRDPGTIAKRVGNSRAEDESRVFNCVVLIYVKITLGCDLEIQQAVVGQGLEEMVEEADARGNGGASRAVELD